MADLSQPTDPVILHKFFNLPAPEELADRISSCRNAEAWKKTVRCPILPPSPKLRLLDLNNDCLNVIVDLAHDIGRNAVEVG